MASDFMDDRAQEVTQNSENVTLNIGYVMVFRWLLSIKTDQESDRQSVLFFLVGMLTHILVFGVLCILVGVIPIVGPIVAIPLLIFFIYTLFINFKAWLS